MFEVDSTIQPHIQNLFRSLILHAPPIGFHIYDGLVRDGFFNLYGRSYKIFTKPNNDLVATAIDRFPDRFLGWAAVNPWKSSHTGSISLVLLGLRLIHSCINIRLGYLILLRLCVKKKEFQSSFIFHQKEYILGKNFLELID
jgi:hypothetical protein